MTECDSCAGDFEFMTAYELKVLLGYFRLEILHSSLEPNVLENKIIHRYCALFFFGRDGLLPHWNMRVRQHREHQQL